MNTVRTHKVDKAFTSGVTANLTIEKMRRGRVVEPGPEVK
jgi:hypothetical protein